MDLEKLARVIMELPKVGELNYKGPFSGEVQEQANNAAKDAEKLISVDPAVESLGTSGTCTGRSSWTW